MQKPIMGIAPSPADPPSVSPESSGGCWQPVMVFVLLFWTLILVFTRLGFMTLSSASPGMVSGTVFVFLAWGQAVFVGAPAAVMGYLARPSLYRPVFRAWALASCLTFLLAPIYLTRPEAALLQAILHCLLTAGFAAGVYFFRRKVFNPSLSPEPTIPVALFAVALAAINAIPWLTWGALGSFLDTLLQGFAALAVGIAITVLLHRWLFEPLLKQNEPPALLRIILAGTGAAGVLVIVASSLGFGFGLMQFVLVLALPSGALNLLFLSRRAITQPVRVPWLPAALYLGITMAAPFTLIDSDELALVITSNPGEILTWATRAALAQVVLSSTMGLILFLSIILFSQPRKPVPLQLSSRIVTAVSTMIVVLISGVALSVYLIFGQVGFYGERLFVILSDQADVSTAPQIQDLDERRSFVYSTLTKHAERTQADLRRSLDRFGIEYRPYYLVNGLEVQGDPLVALWLSSRPEVDRVINSPRMRPLPQPLSQASGESTTPPTELPWNITLIGTDRVWQELGVRGAGIVIGQSDSGVDFTHPDLARNYRGSSSSLISDNRYNWYDPWFGTTSPTDWSGHGTHTLGTILGRQTGIAPDATWYGCVNLARNLGNPAFYLDCMQFMLAPFPAAGDPLQEGRPDLSADVMNNSWGCPPLEGCDPNALLPAMQALRSAGIFVVASAGNDGPQCSSVADPPALYDEVFSVGAIDYFGQLAIFSSRGPVVVDNSQRIKPDLVAPGLGILSTLPGGTYGVSSGTSMAGPHVAGVVALMWSANPSLVGNIEDTEELLIRSAQPYKGVLPECPSAGQIPSSATGYGVLDAYAAVQQALEYSP